MTENKNQFFFDLDEQAKSCQGTLSFEKGELIVSVDGEETQRVSLVEGKELVQQTAVGCSWLELSLKDPADPEKALPASENISLCRFTMSAVEEAAEFCKVVNYYLETGFVGEMQIERVLVCPTCGRAMMQGIDICLFCVDKSYVFRRALKLMKPFLPAVLVSTAILIVANLFYTLMPVLNRFMTDHYLAPTADAKPWFAPVQGILLMSLFMILVRAAGEGLYIVSNRISIRAGTRFSDFLRRMVYEKVQSLSLSSMSKKTSGDLMKRITGDTNHIRQFLIDQGRYALEMMLMFVVILVILLLTNWKLTLMVFIPVPVVLVVMNRYWSRIRVRYEKQWRRESRANSILHDIIKGIRVVKTFGNEEREIQKYSKASEDLAVVSVQNEQFWAKTFPVLGFFMGIGEFFVLIFGGRMVITGEMTLGELVQFTLFLEYIYQPLRWMASLPRWLANAMTSLVKIYEVLDEKVEIADVENPKPLQQVTGSIRFQNVNFGYKSYEPVLKHINLDIAPGEMVGLVGHSGAGKSTLINLIMRLYDPDSGSILIDGTDIKEVTQKDLHDSIGVVFQDTFLFAGSLYDNIAYAREDATRQEVIAAAKAANAHEFIMRLSDGYNTQIGENGHNLSGGERQRLAIARAILKNPKILILDEATSSLDPETEDKIQEALARLVKNRTTIAIAHRLATLRHANRLIVLEKGEVAETGSHNELMEKKGIYYRLVMAQRQTAKLRDEVAASVASSK
ncbi:MAG TPA: ABC transporter ATP-binding protein [Clostridiales bacterium]|nr:ABC transporter ATP-binding protein [Clostridiales bacterium]